MPFFAVKVCYNNCIISRNLTYKKNYSQKISTKKTTKKKYNNDYVSVSICSSPVLGRDDTLKYPIYIYENGKITFRTFL